MSAAIPILALESSISMPRLSTIRIAGWKSIREIDPPLELGPLNVLIGANGSGKSNLFRSSE